MPDSPAFYEERIRLLQAENQRLRDALTRVVWVARFDSKPYDIARRAIATQTLEDFT